MKTVAILGASGFIGRSLCEKFHSQKTQLILFSRKEGHFKNIKIHGIDLSKKGSLEKALKGRKVDTLIYLSSAMHDDFLRDEFKALNANVRMHENVYECWKNHPFHLIYASAVYPKAKKPWGDAATPCMPATFYTISKMLGEQLFVCHANEKGLPLTILRIKAPYGLKTRGRTVVNIFIEKALAGQDLELWGSGKRQQDFIYIKDLAQVFWLTHTKQASGIFNVASGKVTTMYQLAKTAIKVTGSSSRIIFNGKPDPTEKVSAKTNIKKIRSILGFSPKYNIESGLKDMLRLIKGSSSSK